MVVQKTVMSNIFGVFGKSKKNKSEYKPDKMCLPSVQKIIMKGFIQSMKYHIFIVGVFFYLALLAKPESC